MHLSLLCPTLPGWWPVGGNFEGGLTPAACLWEGHLPYMGDFYCTFAYMCSTDLTKETAPITPHLLPTWEGGHNSDSCITVSCPSCVSSLYLGLLDYKGGETGDSSVVNLRDGDVVCCSNVGDRKHNHGDIGVHIDVRVHLQVERTCI